MRSHRIGLNGKVLKLRDKTFNFTKTNLVTLLCRQQHIGRFKVPISSANPAGNIIFQQQCEEMLRSLKRAESTTAAVRRILINEAGNLPNLDQVGGKSHMSKSTLKRRLENESTNFRIICDEVRNLLAQKYLTDTELSVEDIAHLLGYTEMTNFRRAFMRWNKMAPSKFRASS